MDQHALAGDVLLQHATNAMLAHAGDVASLRHEMAVQRAALEAAYAAIAAGEDGGRVPGYVEWRASKGLPNAPAD